MVYLSLTTKLILIAILGWTIVVAFTVLATTQEAIGLYLQRVGEGRRKRSIAHLEFGFNAAKRAFGKKGVMRTMVNVLFVNSVLLPPLALFIIPVAVNWEGEDNHTRIARQWMLAAGFEIWLWGNVLCDTVSFVVTRNIVRRLLVQLKRGQRNVFAVVPAVIKSGAVSLVCLIVAAYATAVAYVFELKPDDWFAEIQKLSLRQVYAVMLEDFAVLGWDVPFPPHLVVTCTSYVLIVFLFASVSALTLMTSMAGLPLIKRIGTRVALGDTTKAHILTVLAIVGAISLGACNVL